MKVVATFAECPHCNVNNRLMNSVVQEEIAKGNMSKNSTPCTQIALFSNIDLARPPIAGGRVPGARIYKDICISCGTEFITRIETGYVTMPTVQGAMPTFA